MENTQKLLWPKELTKSETTKTYVIEQAGEGGSQKSYQLPKAVGDCFKEEGVISELEHDKNSTHYKLNEGYKVHLSDNINEIVGETIEEPDVIFTEKSDGKFDIRVTKNKEGNREWFALLYKKAVQGDKFVTSLDVENKTVNFDYIKKYNLKFQEYNFSRQIIYFGAPGTGKSYMLNQNSLPFNDNYRRITFHPNVLYGDFVGSFKPFPQNDKSTPITYKYVPGVLIKSLIDALISPNIPQLLIIEEINRANVSAAFGDMFQLLDRDENGISTYPIDINEDLQLYLENEVYSNDEYKKEDIDSVKEKLKHGLIFPENLYIWATMNSADQGVMPLDTAFKRRWDFKYFGIDDSYDEEVFNTFGEITLGKDKKVSWNDLRQFINKRLSLLNIPEDKLLGPYFLSKSVLLQTDEVVTEAFTSKVLMYLFEDMGVHNRSKIFNSQILRYSNILKEFKEKGEKIFQGSEELNDKIIYNEDGGTINISEDQANS